MPKKVKKPAAAKMSNTKALKDMVQMLLEEFQTHEREIANEREHCQMEMAQGEKAVQVQMQQMQEHMQALVNVAATTTRSHNLLEVKFVPFSAKDDIAAYLVTFKPILQAHKINKDRWPFHLAPQLTGKAQLAYAAVSSTEVGDYRTIKRDILARYDINFEAYRQRIRTATQVCEI